MKKIIAYSLILATILSLMPIVGLNVSANTWAIRTTLPTSGQSGWQYYSQPINPYPLSPYNGGNCTWYAYGRAYEVHGFDSGMGNKGDAGYWYWAAYHNSPWQVDQSPAPGAIVCWEGGHGHVGFVERVNSDGTVTWTQSNYAEAGQNYPAFETKTMNPAQYATGTLVFQGYIHVGTPKGSTPSTTPSTSYENITPGTYAVKNNNTGTYMCVSYGVDNNLQNVDMYSEINAASRMVITKASTGYKIRPECCASRLVNPYGYTVTSGLNVNIYNDENDSTQWWQFQKVSGGYVIRSVQNPDCVLDTDGGNVFVSSYTGASTQIWSLISTHVHSYGSWNVRTAATCTANGTDYRTCACGAEETRTTTALGHNYTSSVTNPTCTTGGYTTYTCTRCYSSYTANNTSATGHSYGSWNVRNAATCTANGIDYRTCACGAEETRTTTALGHNYTSVTTKPTCTSGGYTTYNCINCGNSYTDNAVSALGHTDGEWITVTEPDIDVEGLKELHCATCGEVIDSEIIPAIEEDTYFLGDVNGDNKIDSFDYLLAKRACFNAYELGDDEQKRADVDGNGAVNSADYVVIKRIAFGTYEFK